MSERWSEEDYYHLTISHPSKNQSTIMKKSRNTVNLKRVTRFWCQQITILLPYLLSAVVIGSLLSIGYRYTSSVSIDDIDIRQQTAKAQARCDISKDPNCRLRLSSPLSNASSNPNDYDNQETEAWKGHGLLNIENFRWIMNNESICTPNPAAPDDTRIAAVMIHTTRDHFFQRNVIRNSWGSIPIYKRWDVRLIFLLGESKNVSDDGVRKKSIEDYYIDVDNETEEQKLQNEQNQYGDLVIGSFIDTFKNLTYKHMMGYKWILNYCPNAAFVIKAQEDKFVDIIRWLDWRTKDMEILEKLQGQDENNNINMEDETDYKLVPDIYCNVFTGGMPVREEGKFYYASLEDWPESYYPDYCGSWAYGTTVDVIKKQYTVSSERKFFWIDDVYVSSLLELAKEKFHWSPVVKDCFKSAMGLPEMYREICESDGSSHFDLEKKFGLVVEIDQSDNFEQDMMCLWKKTLHDSVYKFDI